MSLFKLKSVPFIVIQDDYNKNIIPLLLDLTERKPNIQMVCFEQPVSAWKHIFKDRQDVVYHQQFIRSQFSQYVDKKTTVIIDSINQMALLLGWNQCLSCIKSLHSHLNVEQLIAIIHMDCLTSHFKLLSHLNHIANAIISYDPKADSTIAIHIKKSGKITRTNEVLSYDSKSSSLKSTPFIDKKEVSSKVPILPQPSDLSTFKIEVAQIEKMEKYKLSLPYMSKIKHGEGKVYYEPDAVDDWDDEDPDDDLDI